MKRLMAALALSAMAALVAACERASKSEISKPAAAPPSSTAPAAPDAPPVAQDRPGAAETPSVPAAGPLAATGAPPFAVLYPGASLDAPAVTASGAAGPGGLVTYTTDADPETVVAFYRTRAEAAGLSSVMAMNQGEARAYGAAAAQAGSNLQVVAAPTQDGETSVQLSWSSGQ